MAARAHVERSEVVLEVWPPQEQQPQQQKQEEEQEQEQEQPGPEPEGGPAAKNMNTLCIPRARLRRSCFRTP